MNKASSHKRTELQQVLFDLLKRDLKHYMNTRGLTHMLQAFIEIFSEWAKEHNEAYQLRLAEDFQHVLDRYEQRYELKD